MLCKKCEEFDIQALYSLAATKLRDSKPSEKNFRGYEGFPTFYKHYLGLAPLRASSENGCRLCKSIWQRLIISFVSSEEKYDAEFFEAQRPDQIYLGLSKWDPRVQGFPYLTVIQYRHGDVLTFIGFDVFTEQSEFFHDVLPRFIQSVTGPSIDTGRLREIAGKSSKS